MTEAKAGGEPSMEEILASIRQIINQNDKPADGPAADGAAPAVDSFDASPAAPMPTAVTAPSAADVDDAPEDDEVLELTDILSEAASNEPAPALEMVDNTPAPVFAAPEPTPMPAAPAFVPTPAAPAAAAPTLAPTPAPVGAELISTAAAGAATAARTSLASTLQQEKMEHSLPLGNGMRTLESMAVEALKPLLKEWLDANLPAIVERIVQQEVEKLTKRLGA